MALVTLVLVLVFACIVAISWNTQRAQVNRVLSQALERGIAVSTPSLDISSSEDADVLKDFLSYPAFVVTVNQYGYVTQAVGQNVNVSLPLARQAILAALSTGKTDGNIPGVHLQFRCMPFTNGVRYAFVETSNMEAAITAVIFTCVVVLTCALILLFFIVRFLANKAVRPVAIAWDQQRQFVADASHELKTPLTVILATTGILLSHPDQAIGQQTKWLENTQAEAQRMKKLVEELLFLARSDTSKVPMVLTPMSLTDTLWSCLLPFETIAFEAGVQLDSHIADNIILTADAAQLKQLVMILLDNACKYTPPGGVITVGLAKTGDKAQLTVNNPGEPIPAEDLPHLFERFYRSDKSRAREAGGYGLGLAIAKNLVDAHKGKISVDSSKSNGTTFTVILPIQKEKGKNNTAMLPA